MKDQGPSKVGGRAAAPFTSAQGEGTSGDHLSSCMCDTRARDVGPLPGKSQR